MYAIVEIAAQQFTVRQSEFLNVPLLAGNPGDEVTFSNVLAAGSGDDTKIGTPYISGEVKAKIVEHGKGDKVLVFKKKRRKGYRKLNGHRQRYTRIEITNISV